MKKRITIIISFLLYAAVLFFIAQAVVRNAVAKSDNEGEDILFDFFQAVGIAAEGYLIWWSVLLVSAIIGGIFGRKRNDRILSQTFFTIAVIVFVAGATFYLVNTI